MKIIITAEISEKLSEDEELILFNVLNELGFCEIDIKEEKDE